MLHVTWSCKRWSKHHTCVLSLQVRIGALVQGVLDISGASPRRYFFEVLQHFATAELEVDRLEYFATPDGRNDLYTYNQKEGSCHMKEPAHSNTVPG